MIALKLYLLKLPLLFGFMQENYWKIKKEDCFQKVEIARKSNNPTDKLKQEYRKYARNEIEASARKRSKKFFNKTNPKKATNSIHLECQFFDHLLVQFLPEKQEEIKGNLYHRAWRQGIISEKDYTSFSLNNKNDAINNAYTHSFLPGQITYIEKNYHRGQQKISILTAPNQTTDYTNDVILKSNTSPQQWDWKAHNPNTHHRPGILSADIKLLEPAPYMVLSLGVDSMLQVAPDTTTYLKKLRETKKLIEWKALPTLEAAKQYNEWVKKGYPVAGLFHLTC